MNKLEAEAILNKASVLYSSSEINTCITKMAAEISASINDEIPVFLNVMNGAMFFFTDLLKKIKAPVIIDYLQASRYGNTSTQGGMMVHWAHLPAPEEIKDRHIYIVDDILDEGYTLREIKKFVEECGAKSVKIVVLIDKDIGKEKPIKADFVGFNSPNKFLFGYGMDIYGIYRQIPDILIYNEI